MTADLELRLERDDGGVLVRTYAQLFMNLVQALDEIDRLAFPGQTGRLQWGVQGTRNEPSSLVTVLAPRHIPGQRARETVALTANALVDGVRVLADAPEIPRYFAEQTVTRVGKVGGRVGRDGIVSLSLTQPSRDVRAAIDHRVRDHAREAVAEASDAHSSLVGRLDVLSTRGGRRRIGLLTDTGRGVVCEVHALSQQAVVDAFDTRVLVAGTLKRNSQGQPVRLVVEHMEPADDGRPVNAMELLGLLRHAGEQRSADEIMAEIRDRRRAG